MLTRLRNCLKSAEFLCLARSVIACKTIKVLQCWKREENRLKNGCWKVKCVFEDDGDDVKEEKENIKKKTEAKGKISHNGCLI